MSSVNHFSPTSSLQRQFWLAQQQDEGGGSNNIAAGFVLKGRFEADVFLECLKDVIQKHDALRARFVLDAGELKLFIDPSPSIAVCRDEINSGQEDAAYAKLRDEAARPFDLASGPLMRVAILSLRGRPDWTLLGLIFHHIAVDFRSKEVIGAELATAYAARLQGSNVSVRPEASSYLEFCAHENAWLKTPAAAKMLDVWKKSLEGKNLVLPIATDLPRPPTNTFRGSLVDFSFDAELSNTILEMCRAQKTDPFVALLAAYFILFSRYAKCNAFAVGIPLTNRRAETFGSTVGCFVNILPVSISLSADDTFADVMQKIRRELLVAHRNQELPVERIVAAASKHRVIDRPPLYQIGFTVEPPMQLDLPGLTCEPFHCPTGGAQLDFFLRYWLDNATIKGQLRFNNRLFKPGTANSVAEEIKGLLRAVLPNTAKPLAQTVVAANAIQPCTTEPAATSAPPRQQIAIAATFTAEPMLESFDFWFERLGWEAGVAFAPFNQVFQELVNPSGLLRRNSRGTNLIFLRFDDLVELSDTGNPRSAGERLRANLDEFITNLQANASAFRAPLCVVLCPSSPNLGSLVNDEAELQARFAAKLLAIPGLNLLQPATIAKWYPVADWYEPAGEELGHIPYTPAYLAALAAGSVRLINSITQKPVKALVIDCDGTLWDGVVGEEGAKGVRIGPEQKAFQEFLLEQHRKGVLLCLCSKNHESDAWAVFDENPDMLLKRAHIAFARINWLPKSVNIQSLASEINIGLDAIAFLDDNALERAEVRAGCPSVLCPELPPAWEARMPFLKNLWPLDRLRVTTEDQKRSEHYRGEQQRADLRKAAGSYADFLANLQLVVETTPAAAEDVERLAQLTLRTNQFNTTVRRLTAADVTSYVGQAGRAAFTTRVRDKFGDYGLVGASFSEQQGDALLVDPLLLSCRALGRGVEHRMAGQLAVQAATNNCLWVDFPVKPTDRNEPARSFLESVERECGGTKFANGTLRVSATRLADLRFVPEEATAPAKTESKSTAIIASSSSLPWDTRIVRLASDFPSFETVLAAHAEWRHKRHQRPAASAAPKTSAASSLSSTEQIIATAWKKILALAEIGTNDNFFEVGGTSILAAQLAVELRRQELSVTIVDLFQHPTIAALARNLTGVPPNQPKPSANSIPQTTGTTVSYLPSPFERLRRFRGK